MKEDLDEFLVKHRARNPLIDYQVVEANPSGRHNNLHNSSSQSIDQPIDFSNQEEGESESQSESMEQALIDDSIIDWQAPGAVDNSILQP